MSVSQHETTTIASTPAACPPWCSEQHTDDTPAVAHWSPQHRLLAPEPFAPHMDTIARLELFRLDDADDPGEVRLLVGGGADVDLSAAQTDVFIVQAQAFVDTLRVLRRQMG
jgi:hypothetical protein